MRRDETPERVVDEADGRPVGAEGASSRIWLVRARDELTKLQATPPFLGVRFESWPSALQS
ncbi:hypothetical protein [Methylocapsa aurea]|uniref:hypothetical protein n=1 Tax=Methylocapsa aurea TaxID=663610 RepID=UPI003D187AF4